MSEECPLSSVSADFLKGFITKEECVAKHTTTKYVFGVLIALTAVFLGLVVLASSIAYQASITASEAVKAVQGAYRDSEEVRTEFRVYSAAQDERDEAVVQHLEQIRDEVSALRKEQNMIYKQFLESEATTNSAE